MALYLVKRYKGCYGDNATVGPGNFFLGINLAIRPFKNLYIDGLRNC